MAKDLTILQAVFRAATRRHLDTTYTRDDVQRYAQNESFHPPTNSEGYHHFSYHTAAGSANFTPTHNLRGTYDPPTNVTPMSHTLQAVRHGWEGLSSNNDTLPGTQTATYTPLVAPQRTTVGHTDERNEISTIYSAQPVSASAPPMATLASHDAYFRAREDTAIQLPRQNECYSPSLGYRVQAAPARLPKSHDEDVYEETVGLQPAFYAPQDVDYLGQQSTRATSFPAPNMDRHVLPSGILAATSFSILPSVSRDVATGSPVLKVDKSKFNGCRGPQGLSKRTRAPTFIFHPSLMYSGMPYSETATHLHLRLWLLAQPNTSIFLAHMSSVGFHNPPSSIFQTSNPGSTRLASFTEGNPPFAYREALGSRSNPMGVAVRHEIVPQGSSKNPAGLPNQTGITALHLRKDHGKKQAPA
ncbi:hypothetical protein CC1G_13098 [Coprinopsis cinerea okayama7|uniref:Uncharacterized protein n=1 Tax=Coprinopsis cinerea (strain Okayama-7 / 130 / ATCC MYA-4618 / FGSC 9003) TaxID=240176 RepID=A8P1U7_COPC7|nr:hypothetical protein CC1G_13098 [Coprinopsis cinerea okayama7\|eukprot:XP_001838180.2 hypothetical protein CC1G_13098 [Coprinopsis cinerea okayama7\